MFLLWIKKQEVWDEWHIHKYAHIYNPSGFQGYGKKTAEPRAQGWPRQPLRPFLKKQGGEYLKTGQIYI